MFVSHHQFIFIYMWPSGCCVVVGLNTIFGFRRCVCSSSPLIVRLCECVRPHFFSLRALYHPKTKPKTTKLMPRTPRIIGTAPTTPTGGHTKLVSCYDYPSVAATAADWRPIFGRKCIKSSFITPILMTPTSA